MPIYIHKTLMLFCIAILLGMQIPLGSNRVWALSIAELAIFLNAAVCLILWMAGVVRFRGNVKLIGLAAVGWLLWLSVIALQLVPLSSSVVEWLSPLRAQHVEALGRAGIEQAARYPLSISPTVTLAHLVESFAYATLFMLVMLLAGGRRDCLRLLMWGVFLGACVQAAYGSFMFMSGVAENPLGPKVHYLASATGSFVNRNHFAGSLELGFSAAIGLILIYSQSVHGNGALKRFFDRLFAQGASSLLVRAGIVIIIIGLLLSQSRMGNAAAFGGLAVAGCLYLLFRKGKNLRVILPLVLSLVIFDLLVVGNWFGIEQLRTRYEETDLTANPRATYYPALDAMARAYAKTGSGLGTFEVAYPEFATPDIRGRLRHAHNDYYQFLIEVGWAGIGILSLIVLGVFLHCLRVMKNRKDPTYVGIAFASCMSIACLSLHSLADFNLQIPANAAGLVCLLAAALCCNAVRGERQKAGIETGAI